MSRSTFVLTLIISSLLIVFIISPQAQDEVSVADIILQETEADEPEFTILLDLLDTIDLVDRLNDTNLLWMVFAPTDSAFEIYFETAGTDLETLLQSPNRVASLLGYHLTDDPLLRDALVDGLEINTFINQPIVITVDDETINLNDDATLPDMPLIAENGLIYAIDAVLIRPRNAVDTAPVFLPTETAEATDIDDNESSATPAPDGTDTNTATPTPLPTISATATPVDDDIVLPNNGDGECVVYIEFEEQADVRVGPGNNRTGITFLDLDIEYSVLSYSVDDRGVIWYELDKDEAAPGRLIEEAWVSSQEVLTDGDCTALELGDAPPLIPIDGTSAP